MNESFKDILSAGGKTNSLGRSREVLEIVLQNHDKLEELYVCLLDDDAWVRMRAVDTVEKVCRVHPELLKAYVDRFFSDLSMSTQPSIQWHLAEMFGEIKLNSEQKQKAIEWLIDKLSTVHIDWIVSGNCMNTIVQFVNDGSVARSGVVDLLKIQQNHKSNAISKRASKLLYSI